MCAIETGLRREATLSKHGRQGVPHPEVHARASLTQEALGQAVMTRHDAWAQFRRFYRMPRRVTNESHCISSVYARKCLLTSLCPTPRPTGPSPRSPLRQRPS